MTAPPAGDEPPPPGLREAWLAEMWPVVREVPREIREIDALVEAKRLARLARISRRANRAPRGAA